MFEDTTIKDCAGAETFYLMLGNVQGGASLGDQYYQYVYITDDDGPGQAAFRTAAWTVKESDGNALLTVRRTAPFVGTLSVNYATQAGTALPGQNYTDTSGTVPLSPSRFTSS